MTKYADADLVACHAAGMTVDEAHAHLDRLARVDRNTLARAIYEAMQKKANEIEPGHMDDDGWDQEGEDAEKCRECFRAGADAALAALVDNTP